MNDYYKLQDYKGGEIRRCNCGKYAFYKDGYWSEKFDLFTDLQKAIDNGTLARHALMFPEASQKPKTGDKAVKYDHKK